MALKVNINLKTLPAYVKVILSLAPAVLIVIGVVFFLILPKHKEINELEIKIAAQENEIAKNQAKAAKLPQLTLENENLRKRLEELKLQLPEEKEITSLLKQVSDLCIRAGLKVSLWKPEAKRTHASGIVYEIPVKVELGGSYHSLGSFFSSLTKLNRIVNITDFRLTDPKPDKGVAFIKIAFTATTFSSVPEEELAKKPDEKAAKGAPRKE
ncbi:MAG: type 4a pilus biogenesis protein PilO [Thermodesulfovibrionales bacterium]